MAPAPAGPGRRAGERLAPIGELASLGVRLFTDDGAGVQDPSLMRRALDYAQPLGVRLAQHCEDEFLAGGGSMNEGALSSRLGLVGRPALAEELMVMRDIELVRLSPGARVHFLHLSTARSIRCRPCMSFARWRALQTAGGWLGLIQAFCPAYPLPLYRLQELGFDPLNFDE